MGRLYPHEDSVNLHIYMIINSLNIMFMVIIGALVVVTSVFITWLLTISKDENITENINDVVIIPEDDKEESLNDDKDITNKEHETHALQYTSIWRYSMGSNQTFKWPQQAATLVEIEKRKQAKTLLSMEMMLKLKNMGILRQSGDAYKDIENIEKIARVPGLQMPRKRLRITFDTFLSRSRPGLAQSSEDEDGNIKVVNKKHKHTNIEDVTAKNNAKIIEWKNKHSELFKHEKDDLIKFVREENQGFLRAI